MALGASRSENIDERIGREHVDEVIDDTPALSSDHLSSSRADVIAAHDLLGAGYDWGRIDALTASVDP